MNDDDEDVSGWGTGKTDDTLSLVSAVIVLVALIAVRWFLN